MLLLHRTHGTTDGHQRIQESASFWKKRNWKIPLIWNLYMSPEKTYPEKKFERPPESIAKLIGKGLSLY